MKLSFFKTAIPRALFLFALCPLQAAEITWGAANDTIDTNSIENTGTRIEAINGTSAGGVQTINGTDFLASRPLASAVSGNLLSGQDTLDDSLNAFLTSVTFGGGNSTSITVGGGNLVVGQSYLIQVFFTDLRNGRDQTFIMTYGDGNGNTLDLNATGSAGSFGQHGTGTFTADATTQTLSIATSSAGNAHLTGYQIRTTTTAPTIDSFTASPNLISSGQSTTLSWQISHADSATITQGLGNVSATNGSTTISPSATTTYTLTATNSGGTTTSEITVGVDIPTLDPVLNEFLAINNNILADEDGEFSDWIEIHNPNPFQISLAGLYLTDDPTLNNKWAFPAGTVLDGDSYLIVFASGTSRGLPELHTDFRISSDAGGYLALLDTDGSTVINEFTNAPQQESDFSYGLTSSSNGFFSPPTPGALNGTSFGGFTSDTSFDLDRGFYSAPFTVNVSSTTPGATIIYTTDGTDPSTTNGTASPPASSVSPGSASVAINQTTTLRAIAIAPGLAPTNVDTHTYLMTDDIVDQSLMDPDVVDSAQFSSEMDPALKAIRTLSLVTDPDHFFSNSTGILENTGGRGIAWERPVSIEFIDPNDPSASFQTDAGIRIHGNGSRGSAKNSMRLLFKNEYGANVLEYPLFGNDFPIDRFNTVVLRAHAAGWASGRLTEYATYLEDTFAKDTQGAMGHPTAGSTFVHLYINGTYWGVYNPTERPDGAFAEERFGGDDEDYDSVSRRFTIEVQSGTKTHWDAMIAHAVNTQVDTPAEYATMEEFLDIDNMIDYYLVHQFMQTRDGPDDFGHNNMRLVRNTTVPTRQWQAYAWDMEYSMLPVGLSGDPHADAWDRNFDYAYPNYTNNRRGNYTRDISDSIGGPYIIMKENNAEFRLRYADRFYKHFFNGGALETSVAKARYLGRATEIEDAILGESARWGDQASTIPVTPDDWDLAIQAVCDDFLDLRRADMIPRLQAEGLYPLTSPVLFTQHGGEVPAGFNLAMTTTSGTIVFTTDGSDPREAWTSNLVGNVYINPVPLTDSVTVMARTLENGEWSALTQADFLVGDLANSSNLVVSEILYRPETDTPEFIELLNISSAEIDLTGVTFSDGIDYNFPFNTTLAAGARLVIDESVFENGTGLSGGGERITILAADGSTIQDFEYDNQAPWPTIPDNFGHSLILINPSANPDHSLPESWRASNIVGGSPGTDDATLFTGSIGTDANGNGLDDFLDYALGDGAADQLVFSNTAQGLTLSFTFDPAADQATLNLQWSRDLVTWQPLDSNFTLTSDLPVSNNHQERSFLVAPSFFNIESKAFFRIIAQ